jgi:Ca-activated chloride channel family protein
MKRLVIIIGVLVLIAACSSEQAQQGKKETPKASVGSADAALIMPEAGPASTVTHCLRAPTGTGEFNTESYSTIVENGFKNALVDPVSTFSIDVDAGSYANVRRFINDNRLPPPDAVRIEELVNYFHYDYPDPSGEHPFSIITEASTCPWNDAHRLVHIGIQGKRIDTRDIPPSNLVFLLDVSGSMQPANKLPLLKSAFRLLVEQLRPQDRVAIVVYAGAAGLVLPSTSGADKETILQAIADLSAGGSTAGGAGIKLAYKIAEENIAETGNNRVILATDGDFNVGVSSDAEMVRLIESNRDKGIFLTVLGFGTGNIKDSKLEQIADHGNGNYYYVDNILEARKTLVSELGATLYTIAKDVKIQIEFNPAKVAGYRLIGYENRLLNREDFNDDKKDAGDLGAGHSVTALYEIVPYGVEVPGANVDSLKYQTTSISPEAFESPEMMTVKFRYKLPDGLVSRLITRPVQDTALDFDKTSDDFRFAASVAQFGMLLRDSEYKGNSTYRGVIETASKSVGDDNGGYRREFIRLVENSDLLASAVASE